jgi:hypothetical protein
LKQFELGIARHGSSLPLAAVVLLVPAVECKEAASDSPKQGQLSTAKHSLKA